MRELDWQLFRELQKLAERMEALMEGAFLAPSSPTPLQPLVDVYETPEAVVVEAEMPGVGGQEVKVELLGQELLLSGSLGGKAQGPTTSLLRMERPRGRFHRVVPLPVPVAPPFEASLSRGVLVVRLPKAPAGRSIPITREGA
jgi:HSP20 family protein